MVAMKLTTRPPIGFSASTHALIAATPHGNPCRPLANISGIFAKTSLIDSMFSCNGTARPVGRGEYGSSTSGTTRCFTVCEVFVAVSFSFPATLLGNLKKCAAASKAQMPTNVLCCSGIAARVRAMASHALVVAPVCTATGFTSITKNNAGAMGGRTMYSLGAAYSTEPRWSSGRVEASPRRPSGPRLHMYSCGHSVVWLQNTQQNRPWSTHRLYAFMYALHRPHRTGPTPCACSTTRIGASSGCGSAKGWTIRVRGIPLCVHKSPELGIVLIVHRMYRGLALPKSRAQNVVDAAGGWFAPPRSFRVSCLTTTACGSCTGRGICAGSMRGLLLVLGNELSDCAGRGL
mmetsp:Transcript_1427/g.5427  ORF Transcript_1427/g.5427 Transcript_1427/m.5427 type:complete len:347 (+) Transcript_1427:1511-2551(+)